MSILSKLASAQGRRDETLNKKLAEDLVAQGNREEINEIIENLWNKDKKIQSDCISVLEQIGILAPQLIAPYVVDYMKLLSSKNNRMVWGAMIVLAMVADRKADEIIQNIDVVIKTTKNGSMITHDNGIKVLAGVASANKEYNQALFPILLGELQTCRPKSVPMFAEAIMAAVNPDNKASFIHTLEQRLGSLSASQQKRAKKILNEVGFYPVDSDRLVLKKQ